MHLMQELIICHWWFPPGITDGADIFPQTAMRAAEAVLELALSGHKSACLGKPALHKALRKNQIHSLLKF